MPTHSNGALLELVRHYSLTNQPRISSIAKKIGGAAPETYFTANIKFTQGSTSSKIYQTMIHSVDFQYINLTV